MIRSICVFCGSRFGKREAYKLAASELGSAIAHAGKRLVYGGVHTGLMGALAQAALAAGGEVVGVPAKIFVDDGLAQEGLTELRVTTTMSEGKVVMARLADAFVALPGGVGTYDELFEMLTLSQVGIHSKPLGILNVEGFFDPLARMLEQMVAEGFLKPSYQQHIHFAPNPAALLPVLTQADS